MFFKRYRSTNNHLMETSAVPSMVLIFLMVITPIKTHTDDHSDDHDDGKNPIWNATETDLLKRDLLTHYDKFARPAQINNITSINIDLTFTHFDLDETKSLMTVNGWLKMTWNDEKLKWNKSEYGGLSKLHVGDHEVWQPDIVLYNSALGNNIDHYGNTHLLIYPDGTVLWVPPSQFIVSCALDLTRWPFDRQTCSVKLGSWTYGGDMINITTSNEPPETYMGPCIWKIVSVKKSRNEKIYKCCEEPYTDIQYDITLQRDPSGLNVLVFVPAIGVMILCLSVFWIPSNSGSKFIVAAVTALIQAMFLVYFSQRLINISATTPLIVLYYAYSMILVGISMVVSIITYNMASRNNSKPVPRALANIINSKISAFLLLSKYQNWDTKESAGEELTDRSTLDEDREDLTATSTQKKKSAIEWLIVASALDRIVFFIYVIVFIGFSIRCVL